MESKEKLINKLFEKGVLINKELLNQNLDDSLIDKIKCEEDLIVLNQDYSEIISKDNSLIDWYEVDKYRVDFEKDEDLDLYNSHLQEISSVNINISNSENNINNNKINKNESENITNLKPELDINNSSTNFEINNIDSNKIKIENDTNLEAEVNIPLLKKINQELSYEVVYSYETISQKYKVKDFSKVFLSRYKFLEPIIRQRPELKNVMSINRVNQKRDKDKVSVIGLINDIAETRNGNILLTIEDSTGQIKVLINKNKEDLLKKGKSLIFDEVIGIVGNNGDNIIFADDVIWPEIPSNRQLKKSPDDEYAIFLSDIHVGSTYFLEDSFRKFLKWINGEVGNEGQREIAEKVKYIFIAGDAVDGVGIYPAQESELNIKTIDGQYDYFADLISLIPKDKQIFICPGNHDVVHLAEPQPPLYKDYTEKLHAMENVKLVSNPSLINIGKKENFSGIDVLMYHGYSFDFYVANVDEIRNGGGYHRADLIMKYLLKRRHLAPAFKSTPYLPSHNEDPLLIKKIPDIMITGHIHYSSVANYKGITMISGSCWQAKTKFQEKLGHDPEPGRVPVVNLKTRKVKIMKFI